MKTSVYKLVTISAMAAIFMTACSDSSSTKADAGDDTPTLSSDSLDSTEQSSSSTSEKLSSANEENPVGTSSASQDSEPESDDAESSSSEKVADETASSSSEEAVESSSSEAEEPTSSSNEAEVSSSSEIEESSSSEEAAPTLSEECLAMRSTQDQFIPLEDVFDCVLPKEKLVFVIRHGERDKSAEGTTGDLNENGKSQSFYLGEKIAPKSSEEFYYISTKTYRTLNTDIYISKGKGETFLDSATVFSKDSSYHFIKNDDFTEKWFVKNKDINNCDGVTSWARFTKFAYEPTACPDVFYDADEKTKEFIDTYFMYDNIPNVTIVATHDKFIAPFLISLTDRKIGFEAHEYVKKNGYDNDWNQGVFKRWPNYLAGVAIIVNENDERAYVPVKGLKTGYLGEHCPNNENEDDLYICHKWEKDLP